jgi:hypothetical protein
MGTNGGFAMISPIGIRAMSIARGIQAEQDRQVQEHASSDARTAALIGLGVIVLGGAVFGTVALVKKLRS